MSSGSICESGSTQVTILFSYVPRHIAEAFGEAPILPASCYAKENLPVLSPEFDLLPRSANGVPIDSNMSDTSSLAEIKSLQEAEAERLRLERLYSVTRAQ